MANLHIPQAISTAFQGTKKRVRMATRLTMEDVFNEWRRRYAPKHFTRQAYEYKSYRDSYKRTFQPGKRQIRRSHKILDYRIKNNRDTPLPMVKTGDGRRAFLNGNVRFRGNNERLSAVFEELPKYMYMYAQGTLNKHKALTEVLPVEQMMLASFAATRMAFHMDRKTLRIKSAGRIMI